MTAVEAERAEMRHVGAKRPAKPAAIIAPRTRPASMTDVTSAEIGAYSAACWAGADQYGHESTDTCRASSALAPQSAKAEVIPRGAHQLSRSRY